MSKNQKQRSNDKLLPQNLSFLEPRGSTPLATTPGTGGSSRGHWVGAIVMMPFILLKLSIRPVLLMVLPFLATSLLIVAATWFWNPSMFTMVAGVLFNRTSSSDLDQLLEEPEQWMENLSRDFHVVPPEPARSSSGDAVQPEFAINGEIPSALLNRQPQP